jgi:hypothetical protein
VANGFVVHIGGGVYVDAAGSITLGPTADTQVYEPPDELHYDAEKVASTLKDLAELFPESDEAMEKWGSWGVSESLVKALGELGQAAAAIASLATGMAIIAAVARVFGALSGDEGISPKLRQALNVLRSQAQAAEEIALANKMLDLHSEFDGVIDDFRGKFNDLRVHNPSGPDRIALYDDMRETLDELSQPLSRLRNEHWLAAYPGDAYGARVALFTALYFERPDGSLAPIPPAPPGATHFDPRSGVPMLIFGATTYVSMVRMAMPWFRSAGTYAERLRKTADAIDRFVVRMHAETLARTEHTAESLLSHRISSKTHLLGFPGYLPDSIAVNYPVGAFDLVRYSNPFLWARVADALATGGDTSRLATFDAKWDHPGGIAAPVDLATAATQANERARQDYADLLVASGVFRLVSTAAWLRFLSTPPDRSETVAGDVVVSRAEVGETPTVAKSPPIFPVGVIEHPATLKRYDARARARITTQEPGHKPALQYRVVLRTLDSRYGDGWAGKEYTGWAWTPTYEAVASDPRCKRLRTQFSQGLVLGEVELFKGTSPTAAMTTPPKWATLRASTFDWYLPLLDPSSPFTEAGTDLQRFAAARNTTPGDGNALVGGLSIHFAPPTPSPPPAPAANGARPILGTVDDFWWTEVGTAYDQSSFERAERRHVRDESVDVQWQLSWQDGRLEVRLSGKPEQRSFQAFVVVEETVYSGEAIPEELPDLVSVPALQETLHTPFAVEVVNQLTFVPQAFFLQEAEAIAKGKKLWDDFVDKYAESAAVGPGDAVVTLLDEVRQRIDRSPTTSTIAEVLHEYAAFGERERPQLWAQVLRDAERSTPT